MLGFGAIAELPLATIPTVDVPSGVFPDSVTSRRRRVAEAVFTASDALGLDVPGGVFPDATAHRRQAPYQALFQADDIGLEAHAFYPDSVARRRFFADSVFEAPTLPEPPVPPTPPAPVRIGGGGAPLCVPYCPPPPIRVEVDEVEERGNRVTLRQSIYNFAADIPAETRGRVVTLLESYERADLFAREARIFRSSAAIETWGGDAFEMHLRRAEVDITFDSAAERDAAVASAIAGGFYALPDDRVDAHYLRLSAPPDMAFLADALAAIEAAQGRAVEAVRAEQDKAIPPVAAVFLGAVIGVALFGKSPKAPRPRKGRR